MATIDHSPKSSFPFSWDDWLARAYTINWEVVLYSLIFIVATVTRFWDLGARVMSHDESLHTFYSWRLYDAGDFQHTPLMHGPLLFHAVAFSYFLFGAGDFSARIYVAVLGIAIVLFPILFRRWLGRTGALLASLGLLISPMMLYYSRYIRHDIPAIFFSLVMIYAFLQYIDGERPRRAIWLVVLSGAMALNLASKETAFFYVALFGSFLTLFWLLRMLQETPIRHRTFGDLTWQPPRFQLALGHTLVIGMTLLLGFLAGRTLYYWHFADMEWAWVGIGVGLVIFVRLIPVLIESIINTTRTLMTNDILVTILTAGALIMAATFTLSLYRFNDVDNELIEIRADEELRPDSILSAEEIEDRNELRSDITDRRDESRTLTLITAPLAVMFLGAMIAIQWVSIPEKRNRLQNWLLVTIGFVATIVLLLSFLRFLNSQDFVNIVSEIDKLVILTAGAWHYLLSSNGIWDGLQDLGLRFGVRSALVLFCIPVVYLVFMGFGAISSFVAGERRPGIPQMLTEGLARGKSAFMLIIAGTILGGVIAVYLFGVLDIIKPDRVWQRPAPQVIFDELTGETFEIEADDSQVTVDHELGNSLLVWIFVPIIIMVAIVFLAALIKTPQSMPLPWQDIGAVLLIALVAGSALLFIERNSLEVKTEETEEPVAIDPENPDAATSEEPERERRFSVIILSSGVALILGAVVVLWRTFFPQHWAFADRQSVFGPLIIMGSMIFPWLSAYPLFLAGDELDIIPPPSDILRDSIIVTGTWILFASLVGIAWNWRSWLAATAVFMGLFVFFFTTVFTNGIGVHTGMVGSLGYWLEQQGVRRGSQPQYYYTLIQMPLYEFLPMIIASIAGLVGLRNLFEWRNISLKGERDEAQQAAEQAEIAPAPTPTVPLDMDRIIEQQPALDEIAPTGDDASTAQRFLTMPPEAEMPFWARSYDHEEEQAMRQNMREWLGAVPFLLFCGYWAIVIIAALTISGEKMPWLTTHITLPLTLISGWYVGRIIDKIKWSSIVRGGWALLLFFVPVTLIVLGEIFGPLWGQLAPFQGDTTQELGTTFAWIGSVLVVFAGIYYIFRLSNRIGFLQARHIAFVSVAGMLAILTARSAAIASYQNYDFPTEFLVYAHSGPAVKWTMDEIEYIAERTNQGENLRVAFDDQSSWPMTWYLRDYNTAFFAGEAEDFEQNTSALDGASVVIVGNKKNPIVERVLGDDYYPFDYIRLWWPMQEYFNLDFGRVERFFESDTDNLTATIYRQAVWDIWWERDYDRYAQAQCLEAAIRTCELEEREASQCFNESQSRCSEDNRYDLDRWGVSDAMYVYIDKDIAAEIWDAGIGGESVENRTPQDVLGSLYRDIIPLTTFTQNAGLSNPRGVDIAPDGSVYVADTENGRIAIFNPDGSFQGEIGGATVEGEAGVFNQPWGITVDDEGNIYITDTWNHRIQVLNADGTVSASWGQFGEAGEDPENDFLLYGPRDIALDLEGNVLVADTGGKRIRVYTPSGQHLRDFGNEELNEPVGLAVNPVSGNIYVADTWNQRVQEYTPSGIPIREFDVPMWFENRTSPHRPFIAVSADGTLLAVSDMDAEGRNDGPRIAIYDLVGTPLLSFNAPDTNIDGGEFGIRVVGGVEFGPDGSLYVVDAQSDRVLRFPPLPISGGIQPVPLAGAEQSQPSLGEQVAPIDVLPFSDSLEESNENEAETSADDNESQVETPEEAIDDPETENPDELETSEEVAPENAEDSEETDEPSEEPTSNTDVDDADASSSEADDAAPQDEEIADAAEIEIAAAIAEQAEQAFADADAQNIYELVSSDPNFSILVELIETANLTQSLESAGSFTLFAPTNAAFDYLDAGELEAILADPTRATRLLTNHLAGEALNAETLSEQDTVATFAGENITITMSENVLLLNDETRILRSDFETENGLVHIIDRLIQ